MNRINTILLTVGLLLLLVILIAYWYAALAVAAVTITYLTAKGITTLRTNLKPKG